MTPVTDGERVSRDLSCPVCGGPTAIRHPGLYDDRYGYRGAFDLRRCRRCGHGFLDASFSDSELSDLYSQWYPRKAVRFEDLPPLQPCAGFRAWINGGRHSAYCWVPPNVAVLDVGCGFGQTLAYHEQRGCRAVGVEADEHAVAEALGHGLTVTHGLFRAGDYESASFDYVTMDQVLEHARDPRAFLADAAAVLRPGGTVVVTTPNIGGYGARLYGARWINWHTPYHLNLFSRQSLRRLARDAGLEVRSIRTATASAWAYWQVIHFFAQPEIGHASPFWDPRRASGKVPGRVRRWSDRLRRVHAFQATARITDWLGVGDNLLAILSKPARP